MTTRQSIHDECVVVQNITGDFDHDVLRYITKNRNRTERFLTRTPLFTNWVRNKDLRTYVITRRLALNSVIRFVVDYLSILLQL